MTAAESSRSDSPSDTAATRPDAVPQRRSGPRIVEFVLHPVRSFLFGIAMITLGVLFFVLAHTQGDRAGVAIWLLIALSTIGLAFLIVAAARWPWYRRFVATHGRSPLPPQA